MKFMLDGCDISFVAEAPGDMTVEQLIKQATRIKPDWCACGVRALEGSENKLPVEIIFDYNDVRKADDIVPCKIEAM